MNNVFPVRLKQARLMRGLSMDALSAKMGGAGLSKQSICKYEKGKMMPDSRSLITLADALDVSVDYLFRPIKCTIDNFEFRKKSSLGTKKIDSIKETIKDKLERYIEIENLLLLNTECNLSERYGNVEVMSESDVYNLSQKLRNDWKLGEDGLSNLIEVLEDNHIKVIEIDNDKHFDGLSGYVNKSIPVIVLNDCFSNERKRFTALHELGHLVLAFSPNIEDKRKERMCDLFASELLISKETFMRLLGSNRRDISLQELIAIQRQFGISIDALMYKARQLNIITERRYTTFCKRKNAVPDFKADVEKGRTGKEHSDRFIRLVYRALADEQISISKASELLGKSINDVRDTINLV